MSQYTNVWIWGIVNSHPKTPAGSVWYRHPTYKEQFFHWPPILLISKTPICVKGDQQKEQAGREQQGQATISKRGTTGYRGSCSLMGRGTTEISPQGCQAQPVAPTMHKGRPEPAGQGFSAQKETRRLQGSWRRPWERGWWRHMPRSTRRATHSGLRSPWASYLEQVTSPPWTSASACVKWANNPPWCHCNHEMRKE